MIIEGIELKDVESSNLQAYGYEEKRQELVIQFDAKSVYKYFKVPLDLFEQLEEAQSKGSFFFHHIRDKFKHKRLD